MILSDKQVKSCAGNASCEQPDARQAKPKAPPTSPTSTSHPPSLHKFRPQQACVINFPYQYLPEMHHV